ncbi:MAG TPA: spermidine/putrescine ABC transporter substrate-binding protein [Streptosporangiaceae bacterium]|jgi:spermidine/putrescine transport system substrate-binding protein|nr:spermidine/putrescine ABC transporter substrate-binding protein [Streptosporangiaceae bacterium]
MHPREGWQPDGTRRRPGLSRRQALKRGFAAALLAGGGASVLDACAPYLVGANNIPLPRPSNPVTWPVTGNAAIASNLKPEAGATLQVYNWVAYINQACVNSFAKKYNCKVEVTTFNTMNEALSKLRSGLKFDVLMGATVDVLGDLIEGKLIQPLNHSYITNIDQAWPDFQNPYYDRGWQYTVPYTIYTTGIAWRKDLVHENPATMANPWRDMFFQPKYQGKVAILDDYREGISLGLMMNGIYDLNTTSKSQIQLSQQTLLRLADTVDMQIDNNDYSEVPDGQTWIHHAWSGDMAAAASYMPKGVPVEVVGYWFPKDGKGPIANDTNTVLRSASSPVLAHLFVNYLMDEPVAVENISFNGYMQPVTAITPELLVKEKILPPSLMSTAVLPSDFRRGVGELQLPVDADALWQQAWLVASNGI